MWLLRRLSAWLEATPDGISVELPELAQELGLGANVRRSRPDLRTLARLLRFQEAAPAGHALAVRSEEHTSELQSLMRISYALSCLHKKKVRSSSRVLPT